MPQVAVADAVQLPPDGTGKREGHFKVNIGGTDVYLPAMVLVDDAGTASGEAATSAVTNVAASATSVTLKALNISRRALYIFNAGTSTLFVKLGATATTTTSFTYAIPPNGFWELPDDPIYTGVVDGIWSATGGNGALVTELTS